MAVTNGDKLNVTIRATLGDGTIVMNRKRFRADLASTQTDGNVINAIDTWVETLYAHLNADVPATTDLEQGKVDIIEWDAAKGVWAVTYNVGTYSPLDSFANSSDELPNQCTAFCIGNTQRPKSKGRIFAFPFGEDRQDHGVLTSSALTDLGNFAAQYISDQAIGGDILTSGICREAANVFYEFLTAAYDDIIGTQRRRRFGIGI